MCINEPVCGAVEKPGCTAHQLSFRMLRGNRSPGGGADAVSCVADINPSGRGEAASVDNNERNAVATAVVAVVVVAAAEC